MPSGSTSYVFVWILGFAVASTLTARTRPHCRFVFLQSKYSFPASFGFHRAACAPRLPLCGSLRLPPSVPAGSFHPARISPCWAHWRTAPPRRVGTAPTSRDSKSSVHGPVSRATFTWLGCLRPVPLGPVDKLTPELVLQPVSTGFPAGLITAASPTWRTSPGVPCRHSWRYVFAA